MSGDVTPESLRALAERHKAFARVTISGDRARLHLDTADVLRQAADRITELEAALAERDAIIEQAPHSPGCATKDYRRLYEYPPCDCWKSAAPGDALTARDAEIKAEALEEAADDWRGYYLVAKSLRDRAKAIRQEGRSHD